MSVSVRSPIRRHPRPETVTVIAGLHPVAFIRGELRVKNVVVRIIRFGSLSVALRSRHSARLFPSTMTFRHRDERGGQVVSGRSVTNDPPVVIDGVSYIQGTKSRLREIFRQLVEFD